MSRLLHTRSRLTALGAALLLLAGCSATTSYSDAGDQLPQSDLVDALPTAWESTEIVDDTHIRVTFLGGVDDCYGHDVDVEETASSITISVSTGGLPRHIGGCDAPLLEYTTLVETEQPVGDRTIIDGHAE
ncbi:MULTISPECIES: hypothetical protein [unclassified Brachybacterium]|uniref:hypothetical protein n=1 Tax=unclassified Brachybacterium TaxID=2623841 RepID=UPI004034BC3E